jgi:hypothetical protein
MSALFALPERPSLRFAISGEVTSWDPSVRRLELGATEVWVAPTVSVSGVTAGANVSVIGHIEGSVAPRRVVTTLNVLVPEGDVTRLRQIILDDLRAAERELMAMQGVQPDATRARDLSALREAIAAIVHAMAEGSDGPH